ncbi:MAG: hypothetical protein GC185_02470 [Alphaproteobacteria bacterium]|nr:hypothetical protein [Alphaproteobacteria bacterium]
MADSTKDSTTAGGNKDAGKKAVISDSDAIDTLPLSIIPLSSSALRTAKLIKNSRLETTVELHNDPVSGSLQISPEDISKTFANSEGDQKIISKLATLGSYDVYSLRSGLKNLGIPVDETVLELSEDMKGVLHKYTLEFTRPIIEHIFGPEAAPTDGSRGPDTLRNMFSDPDKALVQSRLRTMAEKTGVPLAEIPAFLEEYNDVFLSVAYYRHTFHSVVPDINRLWLWLGELRQQRDALGSARTMTSCRKVEESLRFVSSSIRERLSKFQAGFDSFWTDINRESFAQLRKEIEENHVGMGAVLCGLVVKVRNWSHEFPDNSKGGGPATRAQYVLTEMEPGLEQLKAMENEARKHIGLSQEHIF